jgi:hypothetical protein
MLYSKFGTIIAIAAITASACAWSWKPVAYQPKSLGDMDAREVAATLIKANTRQGCVTETEFSEVLLNVQFVCNGGLGNSTVRFDQVDKVSLQHSHDWYMVRVDHKNGLTPFEWSSKVLGDMEKLADALHTLARLTSEPAVADATL